MTCPQALKAFSASYRRLENDVQELMSGFCAPCCCSCDSVCCKIAFCRESLESPFLKSVAAFRPPGVAWSKVHGWLTPAGCGLSAGRPPVCYAFLCNAIVRAQPTAAHAYALNVLGMLMTFVGRGARASRHLVELTDLGRLNLPRLARQLETARAVLVHLKNFWEDSRGNPLPIGLVRRICNPGAFGLD